MLSTIGRAAVRRVVAGRPQSTNRAFYSIWQFQRATTVKDGHNLFIYGRAYATATKAAAKPKSKSSTTTKAKSSATPRAKKASTKKSTNAAAKKPVKKRAKKSVAKPKKKPAKKIVTPEEKERKVIKTLKQEALTIPKRKPDNVWKLFMEQQLQKGGMPGTMPQKMPIIQQAYKELTPADIESLNHTANQNKSDNAVMLKEWVESHTPDVINRANNARARLTKQYNKKRFLSISDSRIPKRPTNARFFFIKDRFATGDLKGITFTEAAKLIHREWDALSPSERKVYEDRYAEDHARYVQEFKTVYHKNPQTKKLKDT